MCSLINNVVHRNVALIYQKEYENIRIEYGNIVKGSIITKDTGATVHEFLNVYKNNTVPNIVVRKIVEVKQRGRCQTMKKINVSDKAISKAEETFREIDEKKM